jgi:hypothetical protein
MKDSIREVVHAVKLDDDERPKTPFNMEEFAYEMI